MGPHARVRLQDETSIHSSRVSGPPVLTLSRRRPVAPSVGEFMTFLARTVAERTPPGQRQSVQENNYTAHVYHRQSDQLAGVIISDQEYPVRVAFSLLNKILDEFTTKVRRQEWEDKATQGRQTGKQVLVDYPDLATYLQKYQDPKQADAIMKVQQELDETKIILVRRPLVADPSFALTRAQSTGPLLTHPPGILFLHRAQHKTIESVLERGEKLDSLVDKSAALSASSKSFYKTAKKQVRPVPPLSAPSQARLLTLKPRRRTRAASSRRTQSPSRSSSWQSAWRRAVPHRLSSPSSSFFLRRLLGSIPRPFSRRHCSALFTLVSPLLCTAPCKPTCASRSTRASGERGRESQGGVSSASRCRGFARA